MMTFGNKDKFGIEAFLEEGENHLFIRYCYWVDGVMIGNLEQRTLLSVVLEEINHILKLKGQRIFPLFEKIEAFEVVNFLRFKLLGNDLLDSRLINLPYKEDDLLRLSIVDEGNEVFDDYFLFLLEYKDYDAIIFNEVSGNITGKYKIPKNQFYMIVQNFDAWIKTRTKLVLK